MNIKTRSYLALLIVAILIGGYFAFGSYRERQLSRLFSEYMRCVESSNASCAEQTADKMSRFSDNGSRYYLAHAKVLRHLQSEGDDQSSLAEALRAINGMDYSKGGTTWLPLSLKASVAAMQNNRALAISSSREACKKTKPVQKDVNACLRNLMLSYAMPEGSAWRALQLYESAYLFRYFSKDGDGEPLFYELVALEYLDKKKAMTLSRLVRDRKLFVRKMFDEYCKISVLSAAENGCKASVAN